MRGRIWYTRLCPYFPELRPLRLWDEDCVFLRASMVVDDDPHVCAKIVSAEDKTRVHKVRVQPHPSFGLFTEKAQRRLILPRVLVCDVGTVLNDG